MKIDLFVSALMARYRLFLLIVAATVLTTTVVSLILPKTYIATVSLLTDARDEQVLGNRQIPPPERERLGYLQTQVDILTGPQVARQVVTDLKLATEPSMQKEFQSDTNGTGSIEDWLAKIVLRDVKVDTSQSSVIRLSYSTSNPEFAARVANAFAQAYVDTMLRLRTEPNKQASTWFNEQLKGLRINLEQAQKRLGKAGATVVGARPFLIAYNKDAAQPVTHQWLHLNSGSTETTRSWLPWSWGSWCRCTSSAQCCCGERRAMGTSSAPSWRLRRR